MSSQGEPGQTAGALAEVLGLGGQGETDPAPAGGTEGGAGRDRDALVAEQDSSACWSRPSGDGVPAGTTRWPTRQSVVA